MIKTCARCSAEFTTLSPHPGKVLYCDKCREEVSREQRRASRKRLKEDACAVRYKPVKRVCEVCGEEFDGFPLSKYCAPCRLKVRHEQSKIDSQRRRKKKAAQKKVIIPEKPLKAWIREARECNLDYGTYRALITAGRTFEQLKAEQRSPQFHSHCRHTYGF